jgi:hypothetical protein
MIDFILGVFAGLFGGALLGFVAGSLMAAQKQEPPPQYGGIDHEDQPWWRTL